MRHGRVVTGTQKTRALRIVIATLLSVDLLFFLVTAISGAVNVSRLNSATFPVSQTSYYGDVRSVAAMQAIIGSVAVIFLSYPVFWACMASKKAADIQRASGSPFDRLSAFGAMLFSIVSFVIVLAYTMGKPQNFCSSTTDNARKCVRLMEYSLIRSTTACALLGSVLLFILAAACVIKPRLARRQPARYLQRLPGSWPEALQYRSDSIRSSSSLASERTISSRSPSQYKAKVHHYKKRSASTDITFDTYNPFEERARSAVPLPELMNVAFHHPAVANNQMRYKVHHYRANTPDLEQRGSYTPSPPSSPSSHTCETPPPMMMMRSSHESLAGDARAQRIKRKAVEYRNKIEAQDGYFDPLRQVSHDVDASTFVRSFHNNSSFDSFAEYHDAASSVHEPVIVMQPPRPKKRRPAPAKTTSVAPPRPPQVRTTSLTRRSEIGQSQESGHYVPIH